MKQRVFCSNQCREAARSIGPDTYLAGLNFEEDSRFDPEDLLYGDYASDGGPDPDADDGKVSVRRMRARAHARFVAMYRR
jgi:hypothetical protein